MSLRTRLTRIVDRERGMRAGAGFVGSAPSSAEVLDAFLFEADAAGFRRGQLELFTRLIELWTSLSEQVRSDVEHAYRDGERAGRAEGRDDLGCLAHQDAALRRMKTYLDALAVQGNALLRNLNLERTP